MSEVQAEFYFRGIPTEPSIQKLRDAYPGMKIGDRILYSDVERLIGCKRESFRFKTITARWRRLIEHERDLVIGVVPTIGFEILDNQQKLNLGESKLKSAHKTARRSYTIFSRVDRAALSESDQSRLIHEEHKAASTIACGQIKRTAPKPIL